MNVLTAIGCLILFFGGLACLTLAFQMPNDTLSLLVFIGGILLSTLAFFVPWQIIGHSRK